LDLEADLRLGRKWKTTNAMGGTGVTPVKFGVAPNFVGSDGLLVDE
jgi:hypothetical protein